VRVHKILVVLMIIALVLGGADVADAKKKHKKKKKGNEVPTTLVVESAQGTHITGTVESTRSGCIGDRKVNVTRNNQPVAAAESDSEGQWLTTTGGTIAEGDVIIAKVDEVKVKSKKKKITCGSDSDRYVVGNSSSNPNNPNNNTGTWRLTVTVSGNGTVRSTNRPGINSCRASSGTCVADFPGGTSVDLSATADADNSFTGWSGSCTGTTQPCRVAGNSGESKAVGATFEPSGGGGTACPFAALVALIPQLGPILC
jgi:hypothetical protein